MFKTRTMSKQVAASGDIKYPMFKNSDNLCWLHATLSLIAHSKCFKSITEDFPESEIWKVITTYKDAIEMYNSSDSIIRDRTKTVLKEMQLRTLLYLTPAMKCKKKKPESALCALLNLILLDKSKINVILQASWFWRKICNVCKSHTDSTPVKKPIITLAKIADLFDPAKPLANYICSKCQSESTMELVYLEIPPCLIFNIEKILNPDMKVAESFSIYGREYMLTAIVLLKSLHFITLIRDPFSNQWLQCNDIGGEYFCYLPKKPFFSSQDIYICIYESFDSSGKIITSEKIDLEKINCDQEVITLSD